MKKKTERAAQMDNELLLLDRINIIKDTINKYGEDNFYLSFSGGKDSTVLHYLLDMALPNNKIPRIFLNTGIEYNDILDFVKKLAVTDSRIKLISAGINIRKMLNDYGYPFKSKEHSTKLQQYQIGLRKGTQTKSTIDYINGKENGFFKCPNILSYQFTPEFNLKISAQCCVKMKKRTAHRYEKESNRHIAITGMRASEGGQRSHINCIVVKDDKIIKFHPLSKISDEWENWFISKNNITLCKLYYEPFNFIRTGCKGCPFALNLQEELDIMAKYLPTERKQCEIIWGPIYQEYRRIGYRLRPNV